MTVMTKFLEKDALADFDPNYFEGKDAVFRSFLSGFVEKYVRHYRDRQKILKDRESLIISAPTRVKDGQSTWMEVYGPKHYDTYDALVQFDMARELRQKVSTFAPRRSDGFLDMPEFLESVLTMFEDSGEITVAELADQYGVSGTTIRNWLQKLKTVVYA